MPVRQNKCSRLVKYALGTALLITLPLTSVRAQEAAPNPAPAHPASDQQSKITYVTIAGSESAGSFGGVPYKRTWGTVTGVVAARDTIQGFDQLAHDADGNYPYQSEFEITAPEKPDTNTVVFVEAENRGTPVFFDALHEAEISGPPSNTPGGGDAGNGFLFAHATSYARVQWQPGVAESVPMAAEGVGEVIIRDFGRMLAGRTPLNPKSSVDFGNYRTLILGGVSLSGFFANTFLAEGFNADPVEGSAVFQGVIAVDGTGNWLALNELAAQAGAKEFPYVVPDAKPLSAHEILSGHLSDPFYIDIANYTDFYRLRASLTDVVPENPRMRRYDWPSAHAPAPMDQAKIAGRLSRCNDGKVIDLNPIPHSAYLRAVTLELEHELKVPSAKQAPALPRSTLFELDPDPVPSKVPNVNHLTGVRIYLPLVDENAQPIGGVRFPDVENPVGRAVPPSLPPVTTASIEATCGNLGGWQQFSPAELTKRYGSEANYLKLYAASVDRQIAAGFLLASDRDEMLKIAAQLYERRPSAGVQSSEK